MRQPANKLLILDLDETLVHASQQPLSREADFLVGPYYVYKRPYVDEFLTACVELFEAAVWTSASPEYAAGIVASLFQSPPTFVWAGDRCSEYYDLECGERYSIKKLAKVKQLGYNLDQVIVVDDSPEKHRQNYGNLIQVTAWRGEPDDGELPRLLKYLQELSLVENIRSVEKRHWRRQT